MTPEKLIEVERVLPDGVKITSTRAIGGVRIKTGKTFSGDQITYFKRIIPGTLRVSKRPEQDE